MRWYEMGDRTAIKPGYTEVKGLFFTHACD
jgi:hypothetical protein